MKARGEAQPGVKYTLESLPAGYTLWQRPRPNDARHLDKYLYGHPSHKVFDSPNRFFPHFVHLMDSGNSIGCLCTVCSGSAGLLPRISSGSSKGRRASGSSSVSSRPSSSSGPTFLSTSIPHVSTAQQSRPLLIAPASTSLASQVIVSKSHELAPPKGRPKLIGAGMDASRVDEEGTPDVYRNLINKLRRHQRIDEPIKEPMSLDWRAEQEMLPDLLRKVEENPHWVPRVGEIVLYVRELAPNVHIIRHPIKHDYRMYDEETRLWLDRPVWEAGLVGQVPVEPITIEDICENGDKQNNVTYSGMRIEPLPDVNSSDKSLSKRHKYIPIRHVRPFILWKVLLYQVPKYHDTIFNALAVSSTMSLVAKTRFKGTWPEALIYCRAIYIGHELLAVGDTVRLLPNATHDQTTSSDVMVIKSIRLKWSGLDQASDNDWDEGRPYNSNVWIYGTAFTSNPARMNKEWLSDLRHPPATDDYGEWYPLHPPTKELAVPYTRLLGRLYERDAMALWLNTKSNDFPLLDAGREGLLESRVYSRQNDQRITREPGATWFWADSRVQVLDLHTVNGLDVSTRDQLRDPKDWRRKIKIMDGIANSQVAAAAKPAVGSGLAGRSLRGFMAPALEDLPVRTSVERRGDVTATSSSDADAVTADEQQPVLKRSKKRTATVICVSSDEDNDDMDAEVNEEIRQTMKVVEDKNQARAKKSRVTVVVD